MRPCVRLGEQSSEVASTHQAAVTRRRGTMSVLIVGICIHKAIPTCHLDVTPAEVFTATARQVVEYCMNIL